MRTFQTAGLILWRGGLLFVAGYTLYLTVTFALDWMTAMGITIAPAPKVGAGLVGTGILLVLLSLILERLQDARQEEREEAL